MALRVLYEGSNVNLANGVYFNVAAYLHDEARPSILLIVYPRSGLTISLHYSVEQASRAIAFLGRELGFLGDTSPTAELSFEVGHEGVRLSDELARAVAAIADDLAATAAAGNAAQQASA